MIPKFLRPEVVPYASVAIVPAPVSDVERTVEEAQRYLIHVRYPSGTIVTLGFTTPFLRGLQLIALKAQPVDLKCEDVPAEAA
jgi:hypothetical protein